MDRRISAAELPPAHRPASREEGEEEAASSLDQIPRASIGWRGGAY